MINRKIKSLGDFESCIEVRRPMVDLSRKSQTFSWIDWDLITVYWLHKPEPTKLIESMHTRGCNRSEIDQALKSLRPNEPLKLERIDTEPLGAEMTRFYEGYRARTLDPKGKLTWVFSEDSAFSGGFTCRKEHESECYEFTVATVQRFVSENCPTDGTWLGDTNDGPIIAKS